MTIQESMEIRYPTVQAWLYGGDRDTDVSHEQYKAVRIRFSQVCCGAYHEHKANRELPAGTVMIRETALVDGRWGSCYTCERCIALAEVELMDR